MQKSVKVSMRKLAIALFSACLVVLPLSVHALGFGNIRINSALNEPLDAQIDLLSATTSDLKGLKIKLASQEAFMRAGIERPGHLSQLNFAIRQHSNGRPYLKITTKQSVREPFLDFLLEMNWKNGRMLREYTVLLDPPGQMRQQPTVVASPKTESPQVVAEQEAQEKESPFVEPEPTQEVVEAEPVDEVVESETIQEAEPIAEESIAASTVEPESELEDEPVPLAETVPEEELTTEEPVSAEQESIAEADDSAEPVVEETVAEEEVIEEPVSVEEADSIAAAEETDPFAEVKQPRVPVEEEQEVSQGEEAGTVTDEPLITEQPLEEPVSDELAAEKPAIDMQEGVTTKRNDKLWKIAETMQVNESVTIYQIMLALQRSNPDAFVDGNVHRLKVGHVLRIEDPSLLTAMSQRQAAREYIAQTQNWEEYRQRLAGGDTPVQAEMAGEVEGTSEILPEQIPAEETTGELVLAAPEGDTQSAGTTAGKDPGVSNEVVILREEIRQALREAEIEGNKNIELNSRLRELEGQLNDLQRSLSVKDDELASLQQQLSVVNKQNTEQEQAVQKAEQEAAIAEAEKQQAAQEAAITEAEKQKQAAISEEAATALEQESATADSTAPIETTQADTTAPAVTDPAPAQMEPEQQMPGFIDRLLSSMPISPMMLALGGGGIVVLLVLLFVVRHRQQANNFQESILSGIPMDDMTMREEVSLETNLSGESSFLSDFAISGASALSSADSEVDPLTEADVFMAYGRYEAAEERIMDAIRNDPARNELRIKLLELYNTTKDRDSFERAAEEFYANIGHDAANPQWQKVVAMGTVLAPDSPLFNESNFAAATDDLSFGADPTVMKNIPSDPTVIKSRPVDPTVMKGRPSDEVMDIGLDTGAFQTDDFAGSGEQVDAGEADLDLDMDMDFEFNLDTPVDEKTDDLDLSFDLGGDDAAEINLDEGLDFDMGGEAETTDAMDLEFNLDDEVAEENLDVGQSDDQGLELELEEPTMEGLATDEAMTMEMSQPAQSDMEAMTMDSISSTDLAGGELDATDAMELDIPIDMDEVGTKLDLAKAYIDMGDPDGAKSILDEVLTEGTSPQKQEAQQLMQQI